MDRSRSSSQPLISAFNLCCKTASSVPTARRGPGSGGAAAGGAGAETGGRKCACGSGSGWLGWARRGAARLAGRGLSSGMEFGSLGSAKAGAAPAVLCSGCSGRAGGAGGAPRSSLCSTPSLSCSLGIPFSQAISILSSPGSGGHRSSRLNLADHFHSAWTTPTAPTQLQCPPPDELWRRRQEL